MRAAGGWAALVTALFVTVAVDGVCAAEAEESLGYTGRPECQPVTRERPYLCDVGKPRPISTRSFGHVLAKNGALRATVRRIGMPDWAELQKVATAAPWTNYEVRIYYRDYDRMYSFGRAFILDQPQIALLRYQGPIPPGKFPPEAGVVALADADSEALRAERAAEEAEARAERAARDAARAESIADTAARDFKSSLLKH
jgi:hypothetical protein